MYKRQNFCHVASNNRNQVKVGVFVYRTTDDLATVSASGYFNESIIDINLHDLIIHEQIDASDNTKIESNLLCVTERTLENIGTTVALSNWEKAAEELFVKVDGSSVMSGPLKFSAGSFRGAISGGLNGVTFFKMDAEGNLTQIASLSNTQFVPSGDNTFEIGTTSRKIKNIYVKKINNGHDINVPATNSDDTLALKSQVDDAANSGEQLYTTGVWYAKMYSATTIPAEAAVEGRNYADFSQVDGNNDPIIVVYTYTNGAWALTETITPPKNHNGYMVITSKIWDIAEQAGQQGGLVLWSHNQGTFTPYPRIVSFEDIEVTGDSTVIMPANPTQNQIVNKDYVDSNANPLKYATNCITEIPQDINLTLSSGTLTLKAGSKIYVPNGSGVFNEVIVANDISTTSTANGKLMIFTTTNANGLTNNLLVENCVSGTTDTWAGSGVAHMWYDTSANLVKYYNSAGVASGTRSLPIAIVTVSGGAISSIDQVFNGFGYIGSTVFVLPRVKYLCPDGRNTDGTLKNTSVTVQNVITKTVPTNLGWHYLTLASTGTNGDLATNFYEGTERPSNPTTYSRYYDSVENKIYNIVSGVYGSAVQAVIPVRIEHSSSSPYAITSWNSPTVFHAVDYSDLKSMLDTIYSVGSLYIGTQASCPMESLITGSVWELVSAGNALWTGNGTTGSGVTANADYANAPANTTIAAGAPNITGAESYGDNSNTTGSGAFYFEASGRGHVGDHSGSNGESLKFDASLSNSIYGNSTTVQPPAYVVNVWRRTA